MPPTSPLPDEASLSLRLRHLATSRGGRALLVALAVTALVLAFVPLADHLGFEFAAVLTIVTAAFAPAVGVAAVRQGGGRHPGRAALAACVFSALALVLPTLLILLNGLRRPVCDARGGVEWMLVLPLPSALLAAALGALARARTGSQRGAAILVGAIEVTSIVLSLSTLYRGPAFFVFDHFFGYFPGPLYDEVVLFSQPLLVFRAMTVLWAVVVLLACAAQAPGPERQRRPWSLSAALLAAALLVTSFVAGDDLGFRTTDASLARALGAMRTIDYLELHYPREWSEKQVEQFVRDAAFRGAQVEQALGVTPSRPIRVWMYRSPEEKRRLVGAAATSFAKPWRYEVHVHPSGNPHGVLRHELVHAYAADLATGPFRVPGGLFPNSPLIEGFAVAFDVDTEGLTLYQWAKAMRSLKLQPDIPALLSTAGFYAQAPSRAYTYAGAFIRFLDARFGRDAVRRLYATGELKSLGDPKALVAQFEEMLDQVPITADERAAAERRFSRPSVFHRRCAREVSRVTDEARELLGQNQPQKALEQYEEACAMEPDDPALLKGLLSAAIRAKDERKRDEVAQRLFAHPKVDPVLKASALLELGDDFWRRGDLASARTRYEEAAGLNVDAATHRSAVARVEAVRDPQRAPVPQRLLVEGDADVGQLFRMSDFLRDHPQDALVGYLLGRQLAMRNAQAQGLELLGRAQRGLTDGEMRREGLRLQVRAASELHRCELARELQATIAREGSGSDGALAQDWVDRCVFERSRGWEQVSF